MKRLSTSWLSQGVDVGVGLAVVHDDGLIQLEGQAELGLEEGQSAFPPAGGDHGGEGLALGAEVHVGDEAGEPDQLLVEHGPVLVDEPLHRPEGVVHFVLLLQRDDEACRLAPSEGHDDPHSDLQLHAFRHAVGEGFVDRDRYEDTGEHHLSLSSVPARRAASLRSSQTGRLSPW